MKNQTPIKYKDELGRDLLVVVIFAVIYLLAAWP